MIKSRTMLAGSLLAIAGAASAEIAITPTITTDYDFRGISQTDGREAIQLGLTYTGEGGMYLGIWGSNVDFEVKRGEAHAKTEVDVFAGYAGGDAKEGVGYDVGMIYYTYPNQGTANYPEVYVGMTKGVLSAKLWYSWDFNNHGDTAYYADVNLNLPSGEHLAVVTHAGYSGGEYWKANKPGRLGQYFDWSFGFATEIKGATLTLKWADGSDLGVRHPRNLGRVILSMSTTLSTGD
ncbi:MAG: TorF family putative porin [Steroidobacteraceae bacterium]